MKSLIFGLVGKSGSGKSTISSYLKSKDFYTVELSNYLKTEAEKKGSKLSKSLLQNLGNSLRKEKGPDILAKLAIAEINKSQRNASVIDGIRNLSEVKYLKSQKGFFLLGIVAKTKVRFERIVKQKGKNWVGSYKNFLNIERRDSHLGNKNYGLRVSDCLNLADFKVTNNGNLKSLYREIDKIILTL